MNFVMIEYTDYDGPQKDCAIIGGSPTLIDQAALEALSVNAMALAGAMHAAEKPTDVLASA